MARCGQALLLERDHRLLPCPARLRLPRSWAAKSNLRGMRSRKLTGLRTNASHLSASTSTARWARELHFLQAIDDGPDRVVVLQDIFLNGLPEQQSSKGIPLHRARHSSFLATYS